MSSTRRLSCRPAAVSFVATGCDLPNPLAGTEFISDNPLMDEIITHRSGSLLGEVLVILLATHAVGMAFDLQFQPRVSQENTGHFGQPLPCQRPQGILGRVKENIRHINDEAAGSIASFENQVKLAQ